MTPLAAEALARLGPARGADRRERSRVPRIAGNFLDRATLHRRYKAALKRAGLRALRFHDLRHTLGPR
jgi:integrase